MKKFIILQFLIIASPVYAQEKISEFPHKNFKVQTGFIGDINNSFGPRLGLELNQKLRNKQQTYWGVGLETKWHLFELVTDVYEPPNLNTIVIHGDLHYILPIWRNIVFWDASFGTGGILLFGEGKKSIQPAIKLGLSCNIKLSKTVYFETAPLIVLPFLSEVVFSPNRLYKEKELYTQFTVAPIGVTVFLNK